MKNNNARILFVVAHPDDEVIGCGATIARFAQEGHDTFIAIMGEGETSRYLNLEDADQERVENLNRSAEKAAGLFKVKDLFIFDLPCCRFETVPRLSITHKVESLIEKLKPEIIMTHNAGDLNYDHVLTHRSVLTATRPMSGCPVKEIYTFEVPSSTEWSFGEFGFFNPDFFVDVEKTFETKIAAMKIYDSEVRSFPHPRSPEALSSISKRWGSVVGRKYVEAFSTVRRIL